MTLTDPSPPLAGPVLDADTRGRRKDTLAALPQVDSGDGFPILSRPGGSGPLGPHRPGRRFRHPDTADRHAASPGPRRPGPYGLDLRAGQLLDDPPIGVNDPARDLGTPQYQRRSSGSRGGPSAAATPRFVPYPAPGRVRIGVAASAAGSRVGLRPAAGRRSRCIRDPRVLDPRVLDPGRAAARAASNTDIAS